jgi:phage baseplate assembly protein W
MKKEITLDKALERLIKTQRGSRVMNPAYGIDWLSYIDRSFTDEQRIKLFTEINILLSENETRLDPYKIKVDKSNEDWSIKINEEYSYDRNRQYNN